MSGPKKAYNHLIHHLLPKRNTSSVAKKSFSTQHKKNLTFCPFGPTEPIAMFSGVSASKSYCSWVRQSGRPCRGWWASHHCNASARRRREDGATLHDGHRKACEKYHQPAAALGDDGMGLRPADTQLMNTSITRPRALGHHVPQAGVKPAVATFPNPRYSGIGLESRLPGWYEYYMIAPSPMPYADVGRLSTFDLLLSCF